MNKLIEICDFKREDVARRKARASEKPLHPEQAPENASAHRRAMEWGPFMKLSSEVDGHSWSLS
ncbi:MAG: hypothetical protein DI592_08510 [Stenotrophomonas maltophilia]|nr:MAG: hypothetical protein DI592_08510 [Stenotrophomonas maltophilia]